MKWRPARRRRSRTPAAGGTDGEPSRELPRRRDGTHTTIARDVVARHLDRGEFFWLDLHQPTAERLGCCASPSASTPWPSRTPSTSASGPSSRSSTASSTSSPTAPTPTATASSRCTASSPRSTWSPCTATTAPPSPTCAARPPRAARRRSSRPWRSYRVVDALADSFFPELAKLDDRIDELENGVLQKPDDAQLSRSSGSSGVWSPGARPSPRSATSSPACSPASSRSPA